jgi:hypothetical protein
MTASLRIPKLLQNAGSALSMQGALVEEYEYLSSQCNAAVEALRSSRRAGLKARHAMLNMNDWGRPNLLIFSTT